MTPEWLTDVERLAKNIYYTTASADDLNWQAASAARRRRCLDMAGKIAPHVNRLIADDAETRAKVSDLQAELDRRPVSREQMQAALSRITGPAGRHIRSGEPDATVLGPVERVSE